MFQSRWPEKTTISAARIASSLDLIIAYRARRFIFAILV
jgi:hypothetical protein